MIRQRVLAASIAAGALFALGACGSSSTSSSTVTPAAAPSSAPAATGPTAGSTSGSTTGATTGTVTDTAGSVSVTIDTTDVSDTGSGGTLSPNASAECKALYKQFTALGSAFSGTLPDPADVKKAFDAIKDFVPANLKPDVEVTRGAYQRLSDVVAKAGGNLEESVNDPEVQKAVQELSTPEVEQASNRVGDYLDKECPTG